MDQCCGNCGHFIEDWDGKLYCLLEPIDPLKSKDEYIDCDFREPQIK